MKRQIILWLALVLSGASSLRAGIIETRPFNVCAMNLFGALEHNAGVYSCTVVKREPSATQSDHNIERGIVVLKVASILRGVTRRNIRLAYSCGFMHSEGPLIWPQLDDVGNKRILCVVVPEGRDPTTATIP